MLRSVLQRKEDLGTGIKASVGCSLFQTDVHSGLDSGRTFLLLLGHVNNWTEYFVLLVHNAETSERLYKLL